MRWRVYYGDGSTFDSSQPLAEMPRLDVQIIVSEHPEVGRRLTYRADYYWLEGDRWEGGDLMGLWDYLFNRRGTVAAAGRTMPDSAFHELMQQAMADPDFPPKSALHLLEVPGGS